MPLVSGFEGKNSILYSSYLRILTFDTISNSMCTIHCVNAKFQISFLLFSEISKPQPSLNELNSKSTGQNEGLDNELSSKSTGQNERLDCFEEPAIVFVFIMTFLINILLCLSTRA